MTTLSKEQVIGLHKKLLDATGGMNGINDESLLDSALSVAFQTFDGVELYPSAAAKIARIAYGLVCNHPFLDGNKRIGTYVMMVLLELNLYCPPETRHDFEKANDSAIIKREIKRRVNECKNASTHRSTKQKSC